MSAMEEAARTASLEDDDEPTLVFRRSEPPEDVVSVSEGEPCGMLAFLCADGGPKSSLPAT